MIDVIIFTLYDSHGSEAYAAKAVDFTMLRRDIPHHPYYRHVKCQDVLLYDRESSGLTWWFV